MGIWLNPKRLYGRQNDLDNLTKPIFDAMQRVETIDDDSYVSSLQVSMLSIVLKLSKCAGDTFNNVTILGKAIFTK